MLLPRLPTGVLVAVALLALGGCAGVARPTTGAGSPSDDQLRVVATTTIVGDLTEAVVRDAGEVVVLLAPGQDPHGFAPSARQAQELRTADLVVANGLGLEADLDDVLAAAEEEGVPVLRLAPQLDPMAADAHADEAHADDDHADEDHADGPPEDGAAAGDGGAGTENEKPRDPHVWFDPARMADAVEILAARLAAVEDAPSEIDWAARGRTVADEILAADERVRRELDRVPERCRVLVTNHEVFNYFAARYDFEVLGAVIPGLSSQDEPSAREVAELAETLRRAEVPAIFAETTQSSRLAEAVAAEVGRDVEVVELFTESLGPPGSGAASYTGMLETNARRVADALADC